MAIQINNDQLKKIGLLRGLDESELSMISSLCEPKSFAPGDICQVEGQSSTRINFIVKGKVGAVVRIPNISYSNSEIVLDTLGVGDVFGWSALIKGTTWSNLKALEPTEVLHVSANEMIKLCENNNHLGYVLMKNLAGLVASRLRRNRMATLNAIVAIKGV
jgi:CRP/FNR family cyclic AMP-dependent transcriptional regulator